MAGRYFEEMQVGEVTVHPFGRTVTEADNLLFTSLTMNLQPLHLDAEFAAGTVHGRIVVNSGFTLALVVGMSVMDLTLGTTLGNLGFDRVAFPRPVFAGDTLRAESTVKDKRESRSRPDAGIVWFEHRGVNQHGDAVVVAERAGMLLKRPA